MVLQFSMRNFNCSIEHPTKKTSDTHRRLSHVYLFYLRILAVIVSKWTATHYPVGRDTCVECEIKTYYTSFLYTSQYTTIYLDTPGVGWLDT